MSQVLSYSSVVASGAGWSNGANVQSDNGSYAVCDVGGPGTSGILKIALTNPIDPQDHSGHTILVNGKRNSPLLGTGGHTVTVELRESGTLRASYSFSFGLTDSDKTYTLSSGEAAAISNYNNLELWITADIEGGDDGWAVVYVDYVKLTIPDLAVPAQVTGVSASDGTFTDKVRVTWSAAARASDYNIYRHTADNFGAATKIFDGDTASPYDDTTANPGQTYFYWVRGSNSSGEGPVSASNSGYRQPTLIAGTGALRASSAVLAGSGVSASVGSGALRSQPAILFGFGTGFTGTLVASKKEWNLRASDGD